MKPCIFLVAICFGLLGFSQPKLAYVDAYVVFYSHPKFIEANKTLEQERQKLVEKMNTKRNHYDSEYSRVEGLIQRKEITEEEKEDLINQLNALEREMQEFRQAAEARMKERELELLDPIADEMENELEVAAKERGVDIMFQTTNSEGVSVVLDADAKFDFTTAFGQKVGNPNYAGLEDNYYPKQKGVLIGFTDIENMIGVMPEYRKALEAVSYQTDEFDKELTKMTDKFTQKLEEYSKGMEEEQFSKEEQTSREDELIRLKKDITDFMEYKEDEIQQYQEKLVNPVLQKLEATIKRTKAERQLTMVINQTVTTGGTTILYGDQSNDITRILMDKFSVQHYLDYEFKPRLIEKIGVVEVERVLNESDEFQKLKVEMKNWKEVNEAKVRKDSTDLMKLEEQLINGDYSGFGSREKLELAYDKKRAKVEEQVEDLEYKAAAKEAELMVPLLEKIQAAIDEEAVAGGYQLVVNKVTAGTVWYVREDWEITDEVIARMK